MNRLLIAFTLAMFVATPAALAQECKAVSSDGKPLAGAAKSSFLKKCCEDLAKSKDDKPLAGAAKNSYVDK